MAKRCITREVGPLTLRAAFVPATLDKERRTVDVVWTTGARVLRGGLFSDPYYEELSLDPKHVRMDRLNSGAAPLLDAHNGFELSGVIGVVESARIEKGQGVATVRFARAEDDPNADAIFRKVADGIIKNISVGYRIAKMEKVEGGEGKTPVYRATDWTPHEVSIVPIGADAGAVVRADGAALHQCEFIEENEMADKTRTGAQTGTEPERQELTEQERAAERKAERERGAAIRRIGATLKRSNAEIEAAVNGDMTVEAFRAAAVDALAAAPPEQGGVIPIARNDPRVRIEGGEDLTRTGVRDGVRNALLHRSAPLLFKLEDVGRSYRGLTMMEMARSFLEAHGVRTEGLSKLKVATLAFGLDARGGGHSTSDFPLILADVAGKTLRAAYEEAPQTFQAWARRATLPDFKQVKRTQLGEAPSLTKVSEGGEFTRGTIGEGREVYQLSTYGKVFAITRQTLINDDMDALSRIPMLFGRSVRDLESDLVYAHFLSNPTMGDGTPLFDPKHGNTGAGAISIQSIGAARKAMRRQKGLDKKQRINVQLKYLLVPAELETTAEQFLSTNLAAAQPSNVNVFAGKLQAIAEPRLDDVSTVEWYGAPDPAAIDTLEYGYLEGEDGPFLESRLGFDVDGMEIKARHDFAVKVIDWRGFYKSSGA